MKKTTRIILLIFLILVIALFIHPKKVIYAPKITGKIIDENGNPIKDAIVSRIENLSSVNEKHGYFEYTEYNTQIIKSDEKGVFQLDEKSRIEWIHSPLNLPFAWCFGNFKVEKDGFKTYAAKFDEFRELHKDNCYACENIEFKPVITLEKSK